MDSSNQQAHHLSIDLETYSGLDIKKSGAQAYIRSGDFEILLFAYSYDFAPVEVIDLAQGQTLPQWIIDAIYDSHTLKHAYNAPFEMVCLSTYFGRQVIPAQWRDTMVHGLYCGYTAGLDATGKALGLPQDKRKLSTGKALIRYFCTPCKPTKANGGRTRNYPRHDPDKWELFVEYNRQDVVTEMEIERRLSTFPIPNKVQKQWETDFTINNRGVYIDTELVQGALQLGAVERESLMNEAVQLTGLNNPNSIQQMSEWIEAQTDKEVTDLRKSTVSDMLEQTCDNADVQRALQIRQELGKTSNKKYNAIENAVSSDGRVRGLLQFYGANRTGRWAGRLVQVQNLPQTHVEPLDLARELIKSQNLQALRLIYGSVNNTLSELIRTVFTATPGNVLIDADFSAIEARVISWLAGQEWRLDVFKSGGDIYCASASQMFHCNVVKGGENGHLRAKGKVAELALGYNGGTSALISMGALKMGLSEEELPDIVSKWRIANPKIQELWHRVDAAAIKVVKYGGTECVGCLTFALKYDFTQNKPVMTITLPSGRELFYVNPRLGVNRWGWESLVYTGVNQNQWTEIETYGGKLVENCVQAIARDILAEAIERLEAAGYPVVFHVHDEVVIDVAPVTAPEQMLEDVVKIMSEPISWAPGLPLNADGWVGSYFRKD